jgi:hypothetical protein
MVEREGWECKVPPHAGQLHEPTTILTTQMWDDHTSELDRGGQVGGNHVIVR